MMSMRRKTVSPVLSTKSTMSPQLSYRGDGSPYVDLCPPTPHWDMPSSVDMRTSSPMPEYVTENQIAWAAYQACSRRMNSACVANRLQSMDEQRAWWEETSSVCRNAIHLHNATLNKQYNPETAKHLDLLENAYHVVQTMLDSMCARQEIPVADIPILGSRSMSDSTSSTLVLEEPDAGKQHKRSGFSTMFGKVMNRLTREPKVESKKMERPDSLLYA